MKFENTVEETILTLLRKNNYEFIDQENHNWLSNRRLDDFFNRELLLDCLRKINKFDDEILNEAINTVTRLDNPSLFERNYSFHQFLIDGITVDSKRYDVNPLVKLIDFDNPENNVFQVAHQVAFKEGRSKRIPDVIIFVNGLPLIVMELKSFYEDATKATLEDAYEQLGGNSESDGYRYDIPTLFNYNTFLVISDGVNTKVGTLTAPFTRFNEWKSINGEPGYDDSCVNKLNILVDGLFKKSRLLDVIKNNLFFVLDQNEKPVKIMAQYHQYFGVLKALQSIKEHARPEGDGKAGIIWHTQGSGKSFSMLMLSKRLLTDPEFKVPTIVLLTDRIDLDNQLHKTFYSARRYLKTEPIVAESRADLVKKLKPIKQGGVILTTVGKFDKENLPQNLRNNIIVMTDEAHRGHYGIYETVRYVTNEITKETEAVFKYGVEKYIRESLPNATFIGFTGTPVSTKNKQTTDIFGDIIDVYDMTQSIIDGSTVQLYYESRLAKVWVDEEKLNEIDQYYKDIEENLKANPVAVERSKAEMTKIKVILEDDDIIEKFATDIINHYDERKTFLNGKAMIVCQTRVAAAKLYKKMLEIKPEYKDILILVITESNKDSQEMRDLAGNSNYRRELGEEFKKDTSKYKIAIVVDMWLTGFDVPDLDVMYFIKKLKSHNLMQAIARVNRVYPGKVHGLIVDYIDLVHDLEDALSRYTVRDRQTNVQDIKKEIYLLLQENLGILNEMFEDVERSNFNSDDSFERFTSIQNGTEFVLSDKENREKPFMDLHSITIKRAFVVCAGMCTVAEKQDIMYYLAIRSYILKLRSSCDVISTKTMNDYVRELLEDAIKSDEVKVLTKGQNDETNVIELLTLENIEKLRKLNPPHVFIELLREILEKAIAASRVGNYLKSQEYSKRLRKILEKYNDRDAHFLPEQTILDLIAVAKEITEDQKEVDKLGLSGRERAFYDALIHEKSVKELINDETLKLIAVELRDVVEEYASTDWAHKESTMATMRIKIRDCLKKYNYPPEYREKATKYVLKQAEYSY